MKQKCLQHGESICVLNHATLRADAQGTMETTSRVKIPPGYTGVIEIREMYGSQGLICTSKFIWAGFDGTVKLHLKNGGANPIYLVAGDAVAHIAILKSFDGVITDD